MTTNSEGKMRTINKKKRGKKGEKHEKGLDVTDEAEKYKEKERKDINVNKDETTMIQTTAPLRPTRGKGKEKWR